MKLPNFLHSGQLNALRDAMGAPLSGVAHKELSYKPIDLPVVERLYGRGIDVEFDEVKVLPDGTLAYKGYRVILYIRDISNYGERSSLPKYHLTHCRTLVSMRDNNRSSRYVVANRDDGLFSVNIIGDQIKSINERLNICQNCLDRLSWKGFVNNLSAADRLKRVDKFSLKEFFSVYPRDLISDRPAHTSDTAPLNTYPDNWSSIADRIKRIRGYRCESCNMVLAGSNSRFLHVHHENGQKNDCRDSNLRNLCIRCHASEPLHTHMKTLGEYREFMQIFC